MRVLSLFDGISCGRVALERAKIPVTQYYASEVDKYAIKVSQTNYPDIIQLGDVTKWKEWDVDWKSIDLLIGGSPCQGFSFAGKQLAFDDPRSKLFFVYVDILKHIRLFNPKVNFLLENVKMKKEWLDVISSYLEVEPVLINSALLSAQNRQRYYWANWKFGQPEDKNLNLDDILENNVNKSYYSKIPFNYDKGSQLNPNYKSQANTVYDTNRKSPTLCSFTHGYALGHIKYKDNQGELIVRKITPVECERLQTLPDNYTACVSDTQRYKGLGNGWTVDVIAHIFNNLKVKND